VHTALRASSDTLMHYLSQQLGADPDLGPLFSGGPMVVTLNTPEEMRVAGSQGLSLWLYQVVRDEFRLNAPPERVGFSQLRRTPLPLRLHYLVTPVVNPNPLDLNASAQREQEILGLALRALHDRAIFRGADLQYTLAGTPHELHTRLEPLSLEEITRIWQALGRSFQLSASYEASVVLIESAHSVSVGPPVRVVQPEYGVIVEARP
jgi:hypothetical protein